MVYDTAQNPFQADLDKLKTDLSPSFGTAGAPVVLVMFGDFECPECKNEATTLRQNLVKTFPTQVRVYFKDFPLEQIHPWAKTAAIAGRCVFRQSPTAFWKYFDWIYDHQEQITPDNLKSQVMDFAKTSQDIDGIELGRCIDTKATEPEVDASIAQGQIPARGRDAHRFSERPPAGGKLSLAQCRAADQWRIKLSKERSERRRKVLRDQNPIASQ